MRDEEQRDDLDALFARLELVDAPDDFVARVMSRARQGQVARWPLWQRFCFGALYVVALIALVGLAYATGSALERSHARELIALALQDLSAVKSAPDIYLSAIADALPWRHLLAVVADLAVLAVATRLLLKVVIPAAERVTVQQPA